MQEETGCSVPLVKSLLARCLGMDRGESNRTVEQFHSGHKDFIIGRVTKPDLLSRTTIPARAESNITDMFRNGLTILMAFTGSRRIRRDEATPMDITRAPSQDPSVHILTDTCLTIQQEGETRVVAGWNEHRVNRAAHAMFTFGLLSSILPLPETAELFDLCFEILIRFVPSQGKLVTKLSSFVVLNELAISKAFAKDERVHGFCSTEERHLFLKLPRAQESLCSDTTIF